MEIRSNRNYNKKASKTLAQG